MRLFAALSFLLALAALLGARYLQTGPYWYAALYALPLAATVLAVALASALLEHLLGAAFRAVAPALSVALMLFALLYAIFERAPGVLPADTLPLGGLADKALGIGALGAAAAAAVLAVYASRSPFLLSQLGSALTLGGALFVARETATGFGLPFLSPWSCGLVAASLSFFVFSAWMRRRERARAEPTGPREP